jgi:streptomycin 6-kinase
LPQTLEQLEPASVLSATTRGARPIVGGVGTSVVAPELARFIARHYGPRGRAWVEALPPRIERYRAEWELEVEGVLPTGFSSCCLSVSTAEGEAAVLKLSGPWTPARPEALALRAWDGGPAPRLLRADETGDGALLIERITPGQPLSDAEDDLTEGVAELISNLHFGPVSDEATQLLPPLSDVVSTLITTAGAEAAARSPDEAATLAPRLERTRRLARKLLCSAKADATLLHGDLENRNILHCNTRGLVAIDPLPCLGEAMYDAAYWLANLHRDKREPTSALLAQRLDLDRTRLLAWAAVVSIEA